MKIAPNDGTHNTKSTCHLTCKVDEALNIGSYPEVIYVMQEDSVGRPLDVNVKVKGEKPNWSVNPSDFNYNMSIYGKLRFNNIFSADKEDMIAAFKDGKCIGVTNSKYFEDVDMWYAFLTIYSNDTMQDGIEFRLWDDSTGKIYLADSSIGDISFVSNAIIGTPDVPIIFDGEELMFQNILLNRGWNWLSFNLESNNLNNVTATLANGSWTNNDEVKNDNSTASYSENEKCWIGSLSSGDGFNNLSMYMLNSSYDQVLIVSGTAIDGLDTPISITPQWNYIGYLPQVNMTVKEALADYKAMPGDVLKSQTSFTMYSDNNGWIGNLTYMEANKGYMLFRKADAGTTSFRYPSTLGSMTADRKSVV